MSRPAHGAPPARAAGPVQTATPPVRPGRPATAARRPRTAGPPGPRRPGGWWLLVALLTAVAAAATALAAVRSPAGRPAPTAATRAQPPAGGLPAVTLPIARRPARPPRPGPATTGVPPGTALHPSGPLTVTEAGAVIEGLDVDGPVDVQASGVTIRRCRIRGGPWWGVRVHDGVTGTRIEDTEIAPATPSGQVDAIRAGAGFSGARLDVHGTSDGLKAGGGTRLEASWIHDLADGPGDHSDAVQVLGGDGIVLVGNVLEGGNAAVMASTELGPIRGLRIEGNWLSGGAYTLNVRGGPHGLPLGVRISGNRFARGATYGPAVVDGPLEQTDNSWADGRRLDLGPAGGRNR
ncbi:MAG TPA: hypothetical protein VKG45_12840 [Actinomycetes bacterium]|nr:hypothetical protein [Actinomycetes bacterium]